MICCVTWQPWYLLLIPIHIIMIITAESEYHNCLFLFSPFISTATSISYPSPTELLQLRKENHGFIPFWSRHITKQLDFYGPNGKHQRFYKYLPFNNIIVTVIMRSLHWDVENLLLNWTLINQWWTLNDINWTIANCDNNGWRASSFKVGKPLLNSSIAAC